MSNINSQWTKEFVLPDGTVASSSVDIDRYLKVNQAAMASDYSDNYMRQVKNRQHQQQQKAIFADLIRNYKRSIWNEK